MVKTSSDEELSALQTPPLGASFMRFALSGGICFLVGLVLLYLFTSVCHVHYLISTIVVTLLMTALSFTINRRLTFGGQATQFWRELSRYYVVNLGSMLLSTLSMALLVSGLHVPYLAANITLSVIFCVGNFFFHRFWSFNSR